MPGDPSQSVGPPTEKTEKNIRQARAHSVFLGKYHVEWQWRTRQFHLVPRWTLIDTEFFNQGPLRWFRGYWLTAGVSITRPLSERRVENPDGMGQIRKDGAFYGQGFYQHKHGMTIVERRTYPYGIGQIQPRRTSGDQ